ncbi:peptidoglycan-binding domain-containing protein [Nocardioides alcanivorans]|uniref:peptidoglycan-binding domain-containing protein n=1 Tax=Nocardioides alcanivorans TaxID=2897352 RepID=UPI001F2217ED|nr:peptidoglycan-binding domain-containing protein [Nocardioides alcanivorans]
MAWLSGTVTGVYDEATETAVRGFQAKREIPVTGEVDQRTLNRLHAMTNAPTHEAKHNIAPRRPRRMRLSTPAAPPAAHCASTRPAGPCVGSWTGR